MIENYMVREAIEDIVIRCENCGAILDKSEMDAGLTNCGVCEVGNEEA